MNEFISKNAKIINIYAPTHKAPKYMKHKLMELKGEVDDSKRIVADFNTPLPSMDNTITQKISKDIKDLNNNINRPNLTDIYKIFYWTKLKCTWDIT